METGLKKSEPDEIEKILLSWALRVREDYNISDEARAVLASCLKQIEEAYIGPDPASRRWPRSCSIPCARPARSRT